jgi:hypothetical protein
MAQLPPGVRVVFHVNYKPEEPMFSNEKRAKKILKSLRKDPNYDAINAIDFACEHYGAGNGDGMTFLHDWLHGDLSKPFRAWVKARDKTQRDRQKEADAGARVVSKEKKLHKPKKGK